MSAVAAPRVSVIVPTYNWSAALRCSLPSALAQTFHDFELLVIGDACTDDSEQTVRAFDDPRVRWHSLRRRSGSQSGPNNHGLSIARGELIAYLGHDDVWHPEHLETLVARQQETDADLVCAMAVLYGPPGSGVRAVTGVLVDGQDAPSNLYPPSSILHRRALVDRMGPWRMPDEVDTPVDCEFLARARQHGAAIAGTGRPTVFKFNASWRRDSYRRRATDEQQALLARLRRDPTAVIADEMTGVVRAAREKRLIDVRMPDAAEAPPRGYYRANLRSRGLDDAEPAVLMARRRFGLEEQTSALDWHGVESHTEWGTFRWTGPSPASLVVLPVRVHGAFALTLQVLNWFEADLAAEMSLTVDGVPMAFTVEAGAHPVAWVRARVPARAAAGHALRIGIDARVMRCPHFLYGNADERWLGICVNWVEVEPD